MFKKQNKSCGEETSSFILSSIFEVGNSMLENNICSPIFYIIILLYEFMGQLFFPFLVGLDVEGEGEDLENIYNVLRYTDMDFYLEGLSFNMLISLVLVLLATALLMIVYALLLQREARLNVKNEHIKFSIPHIINKIVSLYLVLLTTVLTIPLYTILISAFVCQQKDSNTWVFSNSTDVTCWTGLHLTFVIIVIILLLFFTFLLLISPIFTDNFPSSKIPWAGPQIYKIFYTKLLTKVSIVAFHVFGNHNRTYQISLFFVFAFIFFSFYIILMNATYLNQWISRTVQFTQGFLLFYVLGIYAKRVSGLELNKGGVFVLFAVCIFIGILTIFAKEHYREYLLDFDIKTTKNEGKMEYYLFEIIRELQLYISGELRHQFNLPGLLSSHQMRCIDQECTCHTFTYNSRLGRARIGGDSSFASRMSSGMAGNLFEINSKLLSNSDLMGLEDEDPDEEWMNNHQANIQCLIRFVDALVQNELRKNLRSMPIRLLSAYISKHFLKNLFKAIFQTRNIQELQDPGIKDRFLIYRYTKYIDNEIKYITSRIFGDNDIDISKIILFDSYYDEMREQIENCSNIAYQFWDHLSSTEFQVGEIYQIGSEINNVYSLIREKYEKGHEIFGENATLIGEMARFEHQIMNNAKAGNALLMEAHHIVQEQREQVHTNGEEDVLNIKANGHNLCIITLSGNPGTFGQILSTNDKLFVTFGHKKKKVIGNNLDILTPKYMNGLHDEFLLNFIEKGKSRSIGKKRIVIAEDCKGFLINLRILVKLVPSILEGIKFLALMCRLETPNVYFKMEINQDQNYLTNQDFGFIVCDKDDQILGINKVCMEKLGIPLSIFTNSNSEDDPLKIYNIFPELLNQELEETDHTVGKTLYADTRFLKLNPNREILTNKEMKFLNKFSGKHKVLIKQDETKINPNLVLRIYRMMIFGEGNLARRGTLNMENHLNIPSTGGEITLRSISDEEGSLSESHSMEQIILETEEEPELIKKVQAFKEKLGTRTTTFSTSNLNKLLTILLFLVMVLSTVCFGLFYTQTNIQMEGAELCYKAGSRWYLNSIVASAIAEIIVESQLAIVHTTTETHESEYESEGEGEGESESEKTRTRSTFGDINNIGGVNKSLYLKDLCKIAINKLKVTQHSLYSKEYEDESISKREKNKKTFKVVRMNSKQEIISSEQSMNTFITQYTAKAQGIVNLPPAQIAQIYIPTAIPSSITVNYFFIKENLFKNNYILHETFEMFLEYFKKENKMNEEYIGWACLVALVIIMISMLIIMPHIIIVQKNKNRILTLYAYFSIEDARELANKCLDYQKNEGFMDLDLDKDDLNDSLICDPDLEDPQLSLSGIVTARTITLKLQKSLHNITNETLNKIDEELDLEDSSQGETDNLISQDWSDTENTNEYDELKYKDQEMEQQRRLGEIENREQKIKQLQINKIFLLLILVFLGSLLSTFFWVLGYYNMHLIEVADDGLRLLPYVIQYFIAPHLLKFNLASAIVENRNIFIHGDHEAAEHLLKLMISNLNWRNDFKFDEFSYSEHTQNKFKLMDMENSYCDVFKDMKKRAQEEYLEELKLSEITKVGLAECNQHQNGILKRGLNNLQITFFNFARRTQAERQEAITSGIDPYPTVNISEMIKVGAIFDSFVFVVALHLIGEPTEDLLKYLEYFRMVFSFGFAGYLVLVLILYLVIWRKYQHSLIESTYRMKGLLKILPQDLLLKVCQLKIKHELIKLGKDPHYFNLQDHVETIYKIIS